MREVGLREKTCVVMGSLDARLAGHRIGGEAFNACLDLLAEGKGNLLQRLFKFAAGGSCHDVFGSAARALRLQVREQDFAERLQNLLHGARVLRVVLGDELGEQVQKLHTERELVHLGI